MCFNELDFFLIIFQKNTCFFEKSYYFCRTKQLKQKQKTMKKKQTTDPDQQEIKRDASGKIIVEFSKDSNSLFQRIKRAVRVRQVDPDEISKFYKMDKEIFQLLFV